MTRRSGFTLIELLVVIAIIAILAAMLFPVFARARESARKIQCLSNVKNIATAVQMYLVDWDRFPCNTQNAESLAYFITEPGGGDESQPDRCYRGRQANPFLRWSVIMDEYVKNHDVYRCPSARRWIGASWIVPNYGRGYLAYLKETEGSWGQTAMSKPVYEGGWAAPSGPCVLAFPPGWGGTITDSMAQNSASSEDTGAVEITISFAEDGLVNAKTSQVADVSNCIVAGDTSVFVNILGVSDIMYGLCRSSCGGADWVNCSFTQECGLSDSDRWSTDPSFRAKYTRHLGGGNVGFADGHASWFNADALQAITPYCECCSDETGYSGSTMHTEDRPIRGLCPYGIGP